MCGGSVPLRFFKLPDPPVDASCATVAACHDDEEAEILAALESIHSQLIAIQEELSNVANDSKRCFNASAKQLSHALVIPTNAGNQALPAGMWVPRTLGELVSVNGKRADALMQYYDPNAAIPKSVAHRRLAIAEYMGVRLA